MTGFATRLKLRFAPFLAAAFLAITSLPAQAAGNIYEQLKADPQFSILVQIIDGANLEWRYTGEETRTVFAPTNTAFEAVKGGYQDMLPPLSASNKENVSALLLYQIVPGRVSPESLQGKAVTKPTYQEGTVEIDGTQRPVHYGGRFGGNVAGPAITASNGTIIPIDGVPIPEFSEKTPVQKPVR